MELVGIARVFARHWTLVALGAILASLLGAATLLQSPFLPARLAQGAATTSHAAATRLLVDARAEPALDLDSAVADTLGPRAGLLSDLLTTDAARAEIARGAGIRPDQLAIVGPAVSMPTLAVPLAVRATVAARGVQEPFGLTLAANLRIPIISVRASGPDALVARRLIQQARAKLERLVASRPSAGETFTVRSLGPITSTSQVDSPVRWLGIVVGLVAFVAWLAGIVVFAGLARSLRALHDDPLQS